MRFESVIRVLDDGINDFAAVHAGTDFVADFELMVWLLLWHLRPILNIVPLGCDGGYIRCPVAVATRYVQPFGIHCFQILFVADAANRNGKIAIGTDEQKDVYVSPRNMGSGLAARQTR
jgi:hypothetical protein